MVRQSLAALHEPNALVELRFSPDPNNKSGMLGYFTRNQEDIVKRAKQLDGSRNLYITLNEISESILGELNGDELSNRTTQNGDISRRRWLFIDFDPKREAKGATLEQVELARSRAKECAEFLKKEYGWPQPSITAQSGNGYHLLWALDLPNDKSSADLVRSVTQVLSERFSDSVVDVDKCVHNASRIIKLWGTKSVKGNEGRYSYPVAIRQRELVSAEALQSLVQSLAKPKPGKTTKPTATIADDETFTAEEAPVCWDAQLQHCDHLRRIVEDAESGQALSYEDWFHLGTHLNAYGAWGHDEFHRLSAFDSRYEESETEAKLAGLTGGPQQCPGGHPDLPPDKVSCIYWAYDKKRQLGPDYINRATIQTNDRQLRDVEDAIVDAVINDNNPPKLYVQEGRIVTTRGDEHGQLKIEEMTDTAFRAYVTRVANFVTVTVKQDKAGNPVFTTRASKPPMDALSGILATKILADKLPPLAGIVTTPVVGPDLKVISEQGYMPSSRYYYHAPEGKNFILSEREPTKEYVTRAVNYFKNDLLGGFPFADEASFAHAMALMLQNFVRPLISGPTPLYLIEAATRGTGKDLLAETLAKVTGQSLSPMTWPSNEEECRKKIISSLRPGPRFVWISNLEGFIQSDMLCTALTSTQVQDRLLGVSDNIIVPNNAVWMATANNANLHEDLVTRSVQIRLDAKMEHPEERKNFKIPNPPKHVENKRAKHVEAALTLIRYWIDQGAPKYKGPQVSRFGSWTEIMGGILECIGVPGFLENRSAFANNANPEHLAWAAFVDEWRTGHGVGQENSVKVADVLYPIAFGQDNQIGSGCSGGILSDYVPGHNRSARLAKLGKALGKAHGRVYCGCQIKRTNNGKNTMYWLEPVQEPDAPMPIDGGKSSSPEGHPGVANKPPVPSTGSNPLQFPGVPGVPRVNSILESNNRKLSNSPLASDAHSQCGTAGNTPEPPEPPVTPGIGVSQISKRPAMADLSLDDVFGPPGSQLH